jgi:hypothetical protein
MYKKNKLLTPSEKKENKLLVKTVLKESVPIQLRAHYLYLISGGFLIYTQKECRYSDLRKRVMQEKKSVNLGSKNVKAEGFHKVRVQIKKDIERVNWPWNKVMEKYEEKDPRHGSSKKKFGKRE